MLYVQRDDNGNITGLTLTPGENAEAASLSDPEVRKFLTQSDADLIRVLEDVIDVLVDKNLMSVTDLPESAQLKLLYRKNTRSLLDNDNSPMLIDDENIL
jgi:hypothetical protein